MKAKIFGGILVAALAINSIAEAQSRTPVINRRMHRQEHRINQGVRSGELTRAEAHHLRADERRTKMDKRMAMADGRVTARERKILRRDENRTSRHIYHYKHNNRVG
jgi:hypothetical protein